MTAEREALTVARRFDDEAFLCEFGGVTSVNLPNLDMVIAIAARPAPEPRCICGAAGIEEIGVRHRDDCPARPAPERINPAPGGVHDHGPEEGAGVACREYRIGSCRLAARPAPEPPVQRGCLCGFPAQTAGICYDIDGDFWPGHGEVAAAPAPESLDPKGPPSENKPLRSAPAPEPQPLSDDNRSGTVDEAPR